MQETRFSNCKTGVALTILLRNVKLNPFHFYSMERKYCNLREQQITRVL